MAAGNNNSLKFTMSYAEFINRSYEIETVANRDRAILVARGVLDIEIDSLSHLRNAFFQVPTDEEMKGLIKVATTERDKELALTIILVRDIQGIAMLTFGKKSGEYKSFGPFNLSEMPIGKFMSLISVVIARATVYAAKMKDYGLNSNAITDLTNKQQNIELLIKAMDLAEGDRKLTTVVRHITANNLFAVMQKICAVGTVYYQDRDAVKAEDYVLYDIPTNVQERKGEVEKESIISRELTGISETSAFQLKVSVGSSMQFYFSKTEGGSVGTKSVTVQNNPNIFTEVKATDLGYSKDNGDIFFCIKNLSTETVGVYRVRVIG